MNRKEIPATGKADRMAPQPESRLQKLPRNRNALIPESIETKTIDILGLRVQSRTHQELNLAIEHIIRSDGHAVIPNINVQFANLAWRNPWLRDFFNSSPLNHCDGAGIQLAARILGGRIAERITMVDWFESLAAFSQERGINMYFLGGRPGVAQEAAAKVLKRYPRLEIRGIQHGYFDKEAGSSENETVIAEINRLSPDILMVAFGMPLQEKWLSQNWDRINARLALAGGAIFDYLSGRVRRAPAWMCRNGMEWLGRLLIEPKRLWKRYLIGNPLFISRVFKQKWAAVMKKTVF